MEIPMPAWRRLCIASGVITIIQNQDFEFARFGIRYSTIYQRIMKMLANVFCECN